MCRSEVKPDAGHFRIDGDCVSFRGLTFSEFWNGWECPWFTRSVACSAAKYLSTDTLRVRFADEEGTFVAEYYGDITYFEKRQYNGDWYFCFGGIWRWERV